MKKVPAIFSAVAAFFFAFSGATVAATAQNTPVQVNVTVLAAGWTQTIKICNTSSASISLKDVTFTFNFSGNISSIWGNPWLAWQISGHQGSQYTLQGGTAWTSDLKSDPSCTTPIVIQFSSTPTTPVPSGPFVFSAAGGTPVGAGTLNVSVPQAPVTGLANPSVNISGTGFNVTKTVSWGTVWSVPNLLPGAYTVAAAPLNNGSSYFKAASMTATVTDRNVTASNIVYTAVPTANVTVSLTTPPVAQQDILFQGADYSIKKTFTGSGSILLPQDTYNITAIAPGYVVTAAPNPLKVPLQKSVSVTYKKASTTAIFGGYFESWSSKWATDPTKTEIANIAPYITHVYLAFMQPDSNYQKGSMSLSGTGLQMNYASGTVLKQAVAVLHQKNPNTKVLISIGGASYTNWAQFNAKSAADFVSDFGLDGIDIDYEASSPGCNKGTDGLIRCTIDAAFQKIITSTRALLPRPYLLTAATWSIAAYGQDQWANSQPQGEFTGMMLPFFRSAAAADLDMVNVMSYDASNAYNPIEGLAAYKNYFKGGISMGIEVPPEAWGGHVYTLTQVQQLAQAVVTTAASTGGTPGMMMWSLQKVPSGTISATNPSAQMMATTVCNSLSLTNCTVSIFSQ